MSSNRGYVLLGIFIIAAFLTPAGRHFAELHGGPDVPAV